MQLIRFFFSFLICTIALALPYRVRIAYFQVIAWFIHLPFKLFGQLARFIMKQTGTENPYGD
ncbi:MAG: hypothetical protein JNJ49_12350 [Bdellovibrionaceae bacterium]|nr:hypothetical protein [Pseudobdellovibrionaceae bacterium]